LLLVNSDQTGVFPSRNVGGCHACFVLPLFTHSDLADELIADAYLHFRWVASYRGDLSNFFRLCGHL